MNEEGRVSRLRYWCGNQPEQLLSDEEYNEVVRLVEAMKTEGGAA